LVRYRRCGVFGLAPPPPVPAKAAHVITCIDRFFLGSADRPRCATGHRRRVPRGGFERKRQIRAGALCCPPWAMDFVNYQPSAWSSSNLPSGFRTPRCMKKDFRPCDDDMPPGARHLLGATGGRLVSRTDPRCGWSSTSEGPRAPSAAARGCRRSALSDSFFSGCRWDSGLQRRDHRRSGV